MGRIHYYRDQPREAIGYFQQVLAVGQELGDEELLAIPLAVMGRALVVQGNFGKAIPFLARAVGLLEGSDEWLDWSFSKAYHGIAIAAGGQQPEGLALTADALASAEETKNPTGIAGCQMVMAVQRFLARDAQAFYDQALAGSEASRRAGNSLMLSIGLGFEAWALSMLGQHETAEARMADAHAEAKKIGGRWVLADWIAAARAELALNAGRPNEAIVRTGAAIEMASAIGGIFAEALARRVWGLALARLGPDRQEEADVQLQASLQLFEAGQCMVEVAHTHLAWGLMCHDRGDGRAAAEHLKQAGDRFKTAGLTGMAKEARAALSAAKKEIHVPA
jgi:tetratricopeptide (TPR) repeat protein